MCLMLQNKRNIELMCISLLQHICNLTLPIMVGIQFIAAYYASGWECAQFWQVTL